MKKQDKKKLGFEKQTVRKLLTADQLKNVDGAKPPASNTAACSQPDGG